VKGVNRKAPNPEWREVPNGAGMMKIDSDPVEYPEIDGV
jgi:hypothetical protein